MFAGWRGYSGGWSRAEIGIFLLRTARLTDRSACRHPLRPAALVMQAQDLSHNGGVVWDELSGRQAAQTGAGGGPCSAECGTCLRNLIPRGAMAHCGMPQQKPC